MIGCLLGQRVLANDGRQLFRRLDDDRYIHLQSFRYGGGYVCCMLGLRSLGGLEYGVAAIQQRSYVCVPKFSQQGSQIGHGNSLGFANIDATQQGYEFWHLRCLTFKVSGAPLAARPSDRRERLDRNVRLHCGAWHGGHSNGWNG